MNSRFKKNFSVPRLSDEQAKRQGRVSQAAFLALGQSGAISFLNGHDESLGGRPLDLAIASDEGLAAVELALATHKTVA